MAYELKINIYRHGTTKCNDDGVFAGVIDPFVTENGMKELENLRKSYPFPQVEYVYVSPASRTHQTAAILFPDNETKVIPEIWEYDFGEAEGKSVNDYFSDPLLFKAWMRQDPDFTFEHGETMLEAKHRILIGFTKIIKDAMEHGFKEVAMVSHGVILNLLVSNYLITDEPKEAFIICPNGMGFSVFVDVDRWFAEQKIVFGEFIPKGAKRPNPLDSPFFSKPKKGEKQSSLTILEDELAAMKEEEKEDKDMIYHLENEKIAIQVKAHGAELVSLVDKSSGREYMWSGDGAYWNRVSPVLFPFVGKLNGLSYEHNGVEYTGVPQHGYARDCDFVKAIESNDSIWFELRADEEWKKKYPFDFLLRIGYRLEGSMVHVMWSVRNDSAEDMPFSIGAHPAFIMPGGDSKNGYILDFHKDMDRLVCGELNENGLLIPQEREYALDSGKLVLSDELFDKDALIIDSGEIHTVSINTPDDHAFLQVRFDTPQLGIWSPAGKKAPFVCIEPWYGRCDRVGYEGGLMEREYGNILDPGHSFQREYIIELVD